MEVRCIENFGRIEELTEGKSYKVLDNDGLCYWLENDNGVEFWYAHSRFKEGEI